MTPLEFVSRDYPKIHSSDMRCLGRSFCTATNKNNFPSFSHWAAEGGPECQQYSLQVHHQEWNLEHEGGIDVVVVRKKLLTKVQSK